MMPIPKKKEKVQSFYLNPSCPVEHFVGRGILSAGRVSTNVNLLLVHPTSNCKYVNMFQTTCSNQVYLCCLSAVAVM